MRFKRGLATLLGIGLLATSSPNLSGEDNLRANAHKLYREVEKRGGCVYFNAGDVHYSAFSTATNLFVHSMILNDGVGFEKLANYDSEEDRITSSDIVVYDKKKGTSILGNGKEIVIGGLFSKLLELLK